jgi:hypothetical protein
MIHSVMIEMVDRILDIMQSRGLLADENDARAVIDAILADLEARFGPEERPDWSQIQRW